MHKEVLGNKYLVGAMALSVFSTLVFVRFIFPVESWLGDFSIYVEATEKFNRGQNAYVAFENGNMFIYHPYVLRVMGFLGGISTLNVCLLIIFAFSIFGLARALNAPVEGHAIAVKPRTQIIATWLTIGSLGLGLTAIFSGNVTFFIASFLVTILLSDDSEKKKWLYPTIILFASMLKPYFLLYLIPFALTFKLGKRIHLVMLSLGCIFAYGALWASAMLFDPVLYESFIYALNQQTLVKHDLGFGLAAYLVEHIGTTLSLMVHGLVLLGGIIYWTIKRKGILNFGVLNFSDARVSKIYFVVLVTIVNPRMKEYDFALAYFLTILLVATLLPRVSGIWFFASQFVLAIGALAIATYNGKFLPLVFTSYPLYYLSAFGILILPLVFDGFRFPRRARSLA